MKNRIAALLLTGAAVMTAIVSHAQNDIPFQSEIEARQAFMQVYRFNLGILGSMARGDADYDAGLASAAADNLLKAASMNNRAMWPRGSDASVDGLAGVTRADAAIWSEGSEIRTKSQDLVDALTVMSAEAGNGLEALQSTMRAVGGGCRGCHDDYRLPED